jgi:deoxyribodipyrimidine photo-lyase
MSKSTTLSLDLADDAGLEAFPPLPAALAGRLAAVRPQAYGRTRNFLDGAVTRLSPYLTHGFIDIGGALAAIHARHPLGARDKLVFEFAWRAFFHHVWQTRGDAILADLGKAPWSGTYAWQVPADVREGRTGVPVIDASVRTLYATGYLHNHARMWLASYLVHLRKVHWRAGADWMIAHLLDGDLAPNHLSWQWVAGTFSSKPYLFNAENVARYAGDLASAGTVIDRDYASLDRLARHEPDCGPEPGEHAGVAEPPCTGIETADRPQPVLEGRHVALVHPWNLGPRPQAEVVLGVLLEPFHAAFPWSPRRHAFVASRMAVLCDGVWAGTPEALAHLLGSAARVDVHLTHNPVYQDALARVATHPMTPKPFFPGSTEFRVGYRA